LVCPDNRRCELDDSAGAGGAAADEDEGEAGPEVEAGAAGCGADLVLAPIAPGAGTLRLNANLDFGALFVRSSSRVLLRAFSC
jgi:hypothetical protein